MPQDDVAEIKEALLAARKAGDENPVLYRKFYHFSHEVQFSCVL